MIETESEIRALAYASVRTYGHTLDASLLKLHKDMRAKAFCEKANGADRRELWRMPVALTPGGEVTVTRMAKLARSTFEMGNY